MKKTLRIIATLMVFATTVAGCTKTEDTANEAVQQGEATLARIMDFKQQMEEAKANPAMKSTTYMSIADAVWNVEALFNLTYAYPTTNYGTTVTRDTTLYLTVCSNDSVLVNDLSTFYGQMINAVQAIYRSVDLDDKQFYVNMFFLQVSLMPRTYLGRWNKLNPDGFSYENTRGNLSGNSQKKLDAVLAEWDKYFVSRTGMYSTEMDMALTFAYMVTKGPDALAFVKENSPDVQKKFDLIVDILESVKAAERGYMQTLLAEDLSKLKVYVPYALSVRLEREYSGVWLAQEDDEDEEQPNQPPSHKIGDPVEVAGRKVNPLILALETKNMMKSIRKRMVKSTMKNMPKRVPL